MKCNISTILKISLIVTVFLFTSCRKNKENNSHEAAEQLFNKSVNLLKAYTDSMRLATDSAMLARLTRSFESKITTINFEFPPETDLRLTEQENDSLIKLTDKLVEVRRSKYKGFGMNRTDSIQSDSIQ